jgi:hypothetical protein
MLIFFAALVAVGIYTVLTSQYTLVLDPSLADCPIEFGNVACFDEQAILPFYNPNDIDLTGIQVFVPKPNGVDIYNVDQPLKVNKTEVLILHTLSCDSTVRAEELKIRWCCEGKCYESLLSTPTEGFELEKSESPQEGGTKETYPEYPTIEDCQKLETHVREFCFDDVAEINDDVTLCELIEDEEIKKHCAGRISLNETMCGEISEPGLRDGCLESINLKSKWAGQ